MSNNKLPLIGIQKGILVGIFYLNTLLINAILSLNYLLLKFRLLKFRPKSFFVGTKISFIL